MRKTDARKSRIPVRIKKSTVLSTDKLEIESTQTQKPPDSTSFESRANNDKIAKVSLESSPATSGASLVTPSTPEHVSSEALDGFYNANCIREFKEIHFKGGRYQTESQCFDAAIETPPPPDDELGTTNLAPEKSDPLKSAYREDEKDGAEPAEVNDRTTNELEKDGVTHESRYEKKMSRYAPALRPDSTTTTTTIGAAKKLKSATGTSSKQRSSGAQSIAEVPRVNKRYRANDQKRENGGGSVWRVGRDRRSAAPTRYGIVSGKKGVPRNDKKPRTEEIQNDDVKDECFVAANVCHNGNEQINIGESGERSPCGSVEDVSRKMQLLNNPCENVCCEKDHGHFPGRLNGNICSENKDLLPCIDTQEATMSIDGETQSQDSRLVSSVVEQGKPPLEPSAKNIPDDDVKSPDDDGLNVADVNELLPIEHRPSVSYYSAGTIPSAAHGDDGVPETASSIGFGVVGCATSLSCSPTCTAEGSASFACGRSPSLQDNSRCSENFSSDGNNEPNSSDSDKVSNTSAASVKTEQKREQLRWSFRDGRLVFDAVGEESKSDLDGSRLGLEQVVVTTDEILYSKDINKRESRSRLKRLEFKLKQAGLTDDKLNEDENCADIESTLVESSGVQNKNHRYSVDIHQEDDVVASSKYIDYSQFQKTKNTLNNLDSNQNVVSAAVDDGDRDEDDLIPEDSHGFSQFDVNSFPLSFAGYDVLYDELDECSDCDEDEDHYIVIKRSEMRGDGSSLSDSERTKHNPDRDNLKSLLKKPGRTKDKKSNRVVFNENKNEFFDADYIILIREECDYDDEDDDGVCTCNQHEIVRLTCCEPNCNCNQSYDGFDQTPPSPKFAPPIEFVDAVTLSPPEGYKDLELGEEQLVALQQMARRSQRTAVCRECSASHEEGIADDGDGSQSDADVEGQIKEQEEKEKTDQSQQTTPTTPPNSESPTTQKYILETITMTTVTQQQILREAEEDKKHHSQNSQFSSGSPIIGILKGGRLWKQQSADNNVKISEQNLKNVDHLTTSDDEASSKRSVRFIESSAAEPNEKRDVCDGAAEMSLEEGSSVQLEQSDQNDKLEDVSNKHTSEHSGSPESTEMTLTFKLGSHVLISNNSLKPNSAVRQLFPCTQSLAAAQGVVGEEENAQQYLVTAESLRAFEEAKRSKLPQIVQSGENDETIKRAIERNTLRRSLIRYEPRSKKQAYKTDNSLVERIKQLTCDVDDNVNRIEHQPSESSTETSEDVPDSRSSPPGEESRNSPEVNPLVNKHLDKSFSPSSSSTSSSNSSSMSSTLNYHRKFSASGDAGMTAEGRHRMDIIPDIQNNFRRDVKPMPDIGGPHNHQETSDPTRAHHSVAPDLSHCAISNKISSSSTSSESRRQFLSTLAPLTACVSMGIGHGEDYYYHLSNNQPCDRVSVASSGTEYSLEDIDEGLKNEDEDQKRIAPDVLAGTPSASESGDELALFVQQDAGRIERLKKKYQPTDQQHKDKDEDDEHDDYGFNRRPSVRGIKPRFGTTTEILQQIQNQLQPPLPPPARVRPDATNNHVQVAWPYYSESGLTDNSKQKNANPTPYQYAAGGAPEEVKARGFAPQYRPTSLQDESLYQNCANQRCLYRGNVNIYSSVVRVGNDYYHSLPRQRNGRPQSPPPMDMSKSFHQTMVYIPYNHIEGYQPVTYYHTSNSDYVTRVSSQNQINKRYIEPIYQSRSDHHFNSNAVPPIPPKPANRVPYPTGQPPQHVMASSRSESPLPGQFSTARSTQTPAPVMSTCGYYPSNPRYRPMINPVWPAEASYVSKLNRHSFPSAGPRYPISDNMSLTDSDSTHSGSLPNGYRQSADISMPNSPTKPRFIERGVPEGAASVQPQDGNQSNSSTMTSPTSPQNPPLPNTQKPMFYAMNV